MLKVVPRVQQVSFPSQNLIQIKTNFVLEFRFQCKTQKQAGSIIAANNSLMKNGSVILLSNKIFGTLTGLKLGNTYLNKFNYTSETTRQMLIGEKLNSKFFVQNCLQYSNFIVMSSFSSFHHFPVTLHFSPQLLTFDETCKTTSLFSVLNLFFPSLWYPKSEKLSL